MSNYFKQKNSTGPILAGLCCPALKAKFSKAIWPPKTIKVHIKYVFSEWLRYDSRVTPFINKTP